MKVARILVASTDTNGQYLTSTWDMILATLQHFTWVIGIKPLPNGGFRTVGDPSGSESSGLPNVNSVPTSTVLTTAVVGELPSFVRSFTFGSYIMLSNFRIKCLINLWSTPAPMMMLACIMSLHRCANYHPIK